MNWVDPEGLHGPVLFGKLPPYFYRIPILRNSIRPVRNIPRSTQNQPLRYVPRPAPDILPKSFWARFLQRLADWLSEMGFGGTLPTIYNPPSDSDDPCEKKEPKSWPPKGIPPDWIS